VKPPPLAYERPSSLDEALALLAESGDEAKVLAGGQSLIPLLNMRMASPRLVIDINRIPALADVHDDGATARVGALVRQSAFSGVSRLGDLCLPSIGHYVTRNRGTVCGSVAHADARAELPLALLALGGSVVAASRERDRSIPATDFFVTHFTTSLSPDELVVETVWPTLAEGSGCAFEEFSLRAGDYALGMAACTLALRDSRVLVARVAVGAVVDRPTLLEEIDALLAGQAVDAEVAREAGEIAARAVDPADGLHATAAYQRHLTALLVERVVLRAWADATGVAT
jgi:carbon-monoxide dehydrogenase medium subunit/2-furoyl-CoA dehydrogenase FAD binding subunit